MPIRTIDLPAAVRNSDRVSLGFSEGVLSLVGSSGFTFHHLSSAFHSPVWQSPPLCHHLAVSECPQGESYGSRRIADWHGDPPNRPAGRCRAYLRSSRDILGTLLAMYQRPASHCRNRS